MSKRSRKQIISLLSLVLILLLLGGFLYAVDLRALAQALLATNLGWFAAALMIGILWNVFPALRLWIMLRKQAIRIPFGQLLLANFGIRFYSFFSPISSVGSVMRFERLVPPEKAAEGIAAFGAQRVFDITFALLMSTFWALAAHGGAINTGPLTLVLMLGILLIWFTWRQGHRVADWAESRAGLSPERTRRYYAVVGRLARAFNVYARFSRPELAALVGIALAGDLVSFSGYLCLARSLNVPLGPADLGWIRSLGLLAAYTPFTLPGGLGMREVSSLVLMAGLGIRAETASAFSMLLYLRGVLTALLGGALEAMSNVGVLRGAQRVE